MRGRANSCRLMVYSIHCSAYYFSSSPKHSMAQPLFYPTKLTLSNKFVESPALVMQTLPWYSFNNSFQCIYTHLTSSNLFWNNCVEQPPPTTKHNVWFKSSIRMKSWSNLTEGNILEVILFSTFYITALQIPISKRNKNASWVKKKFSKFFLMKHHPFLGLWPPRSHTN